MGKVRFDKLLNKPLLHDHPHDHPKVQGVGSSGSAGVSSHADLTNVTANQHHAQAHNQIDHSSATTEIADVASAEAAGTSETTPRGDHVHAHGSGYLPNAHHNQAHAIDGADHTGAITSAQHGTFASGDLHPEYQTPAEHTAVGDSSPHHAAVSLAADIDTILGLSVQQLTLDSQSANQVFAGPTTGGAADPTFRSMVSADLPASVVETTDADWIDLTDAGATTLHSHAGGSGYATIEDEGVALTARTTLDIRGQYLSAVEDALNTQTVLRSGYGVPDAIVDRETTEHYYGLATGSAATTLGDTFARWTTNRWSDLGCIVKVISGTGTAGEERTISSNTATALTISAPWTVNPDGTTVYAIGPADRLSSASGLAVGATLDDSGQAWGTNQYARCTVIIFGGTGVNQVRTISSNTATQLTVSAAWTTQPDATSTYLIQFPEPVYVRLRDAVTAGHRSILVRHPGDTSALTIATTDNVNVIIGDDGSDAIFRVGLTCNKNGVVFDSIQMDGVSLGLVGISDIAVGCQVRNASGRINMGSASSGSAILNCAAVAAGSGATAPFEVRGSNQRVTACFGQLLSNQNFIKIYSTAAQYSVIGNANVANAESGYIIDEASNALGGVISANVVSVPLSNALGGINAQLLSNIAGNYINFNSGTPAASTYNGINVSGRCVVAGNLIRTAVGTNATILNAINATGSGSSIGNNLLILNAAPNNASAVYTVVSLPAGSSLNNVVGNLGYAISGITAGTCYLIGGASTDFTAFGNTGIGSAPSVAPYPWRQFQSLGVLSNAFGNTDLPELQIFAYDRFEDFDDNAIPNDWEEIVVGSATYGGGAAGGLVTVTTLGVANDDRGIRFNQGVVQGSGKRPGTEARFNLTSVAAIEYRIGLGDYAGWVTNMARPTDGLFLELDTSLDANFHLIMKTGATVQDIVVQTPATTGVHTFAAYCSRGNRLTAYFDGSFVGTYITTGIWAAANLVSPGIYIETLANVVKAVSVDVVRWRSDR